MLEKMFAYKNDKKGFSLTLLGITFKIKKYPYSDKMMTKLYEQRRKEIAKKKKVRVLFLVRENQKWTYQSLYDEMAKDELFEPFVAVTMLTDVLENNDKTRFNLEENYNFFAARGMNVEYAFKDGEFVDLAVFEPDIVFYDQQYSLPEIYMPQNVAKFALTFYCPYSFQLFDFKPDYTQSFHRLMYRVYVEHELTKIRFDKYKKGNSKNCKVVGYPKLDVYKQNKLQNDEKYWKDCDKFRVIYAPHHSFETKGLNLATFRKNGRFILELAKKHSETTWLFKPHPRFAHALQANGIMSAEEVKEYYNEWEKIGVVYTQGDYFGIFNSSNMMVTDCCSFLAEYLPTHNPIIRPMKKKSEEKFADLDDLGKRIVSGYYHVDSNDALAEVFEGLLLAEDEKRVDLRKNLAKEILPEDSLVAEKMLEDVKNAIGR